MADFFNMLSEIGDAFNRGREAGRKRGLLAEIGQTAASGDYLSAGHRAMQAGEVGLGLRLIDQGRQLSKAGYQPSSSPSGSELEPAAQRKVQSGGGNALVAQTAHDEFLKAGFSPAQARIGAAALAGQAGQESGFNPTLTHDGGTGYGLYGHRLDRRTAMFNFLDQNGYGRDDAAGQTRFAVHELLNDPRYRQSVAAIRSGNLGAATRALMTNFEAPDPKLANLGNRMRHAAASLQLLGKGQAGAQPSDGQWMEAKGDASQLRPGTLPGIPMPQVQRSPEFPVTASRSSPRAPTTNLLSSIMPQGGQQDVQIIPDGRGGFVPITNSRYDPRTGEFLAPGSYQVPQAPAAAPGQAPVQQPVTGIPLPPVRPSAPMPPSPPSDLPGSTPQTAHPAPGRQASPAPRPASVPVPARRPVHLPPMSANAERGTPSSPPITGSAGANDLPIFAQGPLPYQPSQPGSELLSRISGVPNYKIATPASVQPAASPNPVDQPVVQPDAAPASVEQTATPAPAEQPPVQPAPAVTAAAKKPAVKKGKESTGPDLKEYQTAYANYGSRMAESDRLLSDPEIINTALGGTGLYNSAASSIPKVGNALVSTNYQKLEQAQRNFITAVLRKESGAAIAESEFENARKQYFPVFGDSPEVIAQKAENRRTVIENFHRVAGDAAGPALKEYQGSNMNYARRMADAEDVVSDPAVYGEVLGKKGLAQDIVSGVPVAGNAAVSTNFQRFAQAKRNWINANLRKESGAQISESEFATADKQYFPQFGDSDEVIRQKEETRRLVASNMARNSGDQATIDFVNQRLSGARQHALVDQPTPVDQPSSGGLISDIAASAASGLGRAAGGFLGLPGTLRQGVDQLFDYAGAPPRADTWTDSLRVPSGSDVTGIIPGASYEPKTTAGRYAQSFGEFAPAAVLGPGGAVLKTAQATIPAVVTQFTEDQAAAGNAPAWAPAAAAVASTLAVPAAAGAYNWTKGAFIRTFAGDGRQAVAKALKDIPNDQIDDVIQRTEQLMADAQSQGINLTRAEAVQQVTGGATRLGDIQRVAEGQGAMRQFMAQRPEQVRAAVRGSLDDIAPAPQSPGTIGPQASRAADDIIQETQAGINAKTRPLYDQAARARVDPATVAGLADDPLYAQTLQGIRNNPALNRTIANLPDDSPVVIDLVRQRLQEQAANARIPGQADTSNLAATNIDDAATAARKAATQASPELTTALAEQARLRREHLDPLMAGPIGKIANKPDTQNAINALFPKNPVANSAGEVMDAVSKLSAKNPWAARQLVRAHIEGVFNQATRGLQGGQNQFGGASFWAALKGNEQAAANIEAAIRGLPNGDKILPGFNRLTEVLAATGQRQRIGSQTAFNQELLREMGGAGGGDAVSSAVTVLTGNPVAGGLAKLPRILGEKFQDWRMGKNIEEIATLLTDPKGADAFRALATAGRNPNKVKAALARIAGLAKQTAKGAAKTAAAASVHGLKAATVPAVYEDQ